MAENTLRPVVYVVSDSLGETGEFVVKAAATQFVPQQVEIRRFPFVESKESIDQALRAASRNQAFVVFTLVIPQLREYMIERANEMGIVAIDLLGSIIQNLERTSGREAKHEPGMIHKLDEDYFKRVEAIEFAVKYDDGRDSSGISKADIVLVGVSRTSKTPLSMYLAHKTFKVANVPLVPELKPPKELFEVPKEKVIGLKISPEKLNAIRKERLKALGLAENAKYANEERIREELEFAHDVMKTLRCPVIEVSDKAVEETASVILSLFNIRS